VWANLLHIVLTRGFIPGDRRTKMSHRSPPNRGSAVRVGGYIYCAIRGKFLLRHSLGRASLNRHGPPLKGVSCGMRLSKLRCAGIVASVLWAIVGGTWGIRLAEYDAVSLSTAYMTCFLSSGERVPSEPCERMGEELGGYPYWTNRIIGVSAFGLLPIPFGWLMGFIMIRIGRWVMNGEPATP